MKQLLYTDLDKTLLVDEGGVLKVSAANIESIKKFTAAGHYFGIASGRNLQNVKSFLKPLLPYINLPFVLSNGSAVYEEKTEELLFSAPISDTFIRAFLDFYKRRDDFIFVAGTFDGYLVLERAGSSKLPTISFPVNFIKEEDLFSLPILKVMAFIKKEYFETISTDIKAFVEPFKMNVEPSDKQLIEIVGPQIDKARGIKEAIKIKDFTNYELNTIGDFYNDISMLKIAHFSAAPADAAMAVKAIANVIVAKHDENAVSEFINLILKK